MKLPRYDPDAKDSVLLVAGIALLFGQMVLQALGREPSYLMVAAALSLCFGIPLLYGMERERRRREDENQ